MTPDLRGLALDTTAADLGFEGGDALTVYGALLDMGPATIASFLTGDASLYLRPAGGFLGGIQHDSIAAAAQRMVEVAATVASSMNAAEGHPELPPDGTLQFITLAVGARLVARVPLAEAQAPGTPFYPLYCAAQDVLTEIRLVAERADPPTPPAHQPVAR